MKPVPFAVSSIGCIGSFFVLILNSNLIRSLYSTSLKNKYEHQLFTLRFFVDLITAVLNVIYFGATAASFIFNFYLFEYPVLYYWTTFLSSIQVSKFYLAFLISFERFIAVFFPIIFHNYRRRFSNRFAIIIIIVCGIIDDLIYFQVCHVVRKIKCYTIGCSANACYLDYFVLMKLILSWTTTFISLALFFRLFCVNRKYANADFKRTNYMCLADAALSVIFDFFPYLITKFFEEIILSGDGVGPFNSTVRVFQILIDAIIASYLIMSMKPNKVQVLNPLSKTRSVT